MKSKWIEKLDYLKKSVLEENKSYEELGREFCCSGSNIKKVLKRFGVVLPQKRAINENETFNKKKYFCLNCGNELYGGLKKYCDKCCEKEHKHLIKYKYFLEHENEFKRANYNPRAFKKDILKEQNWKCAICDCGTMWNGKELVFILDHIDGHASHNYRTNLRLICPNCDSQLDTYKSKNKNGERSYYRYHRSALVETQGVEEG